MSAPTAPTCRTAPCSMLTGRYRVPAYRAIGACAAHQQDAGRDLSRARPLREHVRARAADGRGRRQARHRPHRGAPAQSHPGGRDAVHDRVQRAGHRGARSSIPATMPRLLDKALAAFGWDEVAGRAETPPRRRRGGRRRLAIFLEESGRGPTRQREDHGRHRRRRRAGHRRRLDRPGLSRPRWRRSAPRRSASTTRACA